MAWNWDFWRREASWGDTARKDGKFEAGLDGRPAQGSTPRSSSAMSVAGPPRPNKTEDWEARLLAAGLSREWSTRFAKQVGAAAIELTPEAEAGLVQGFVLAMEAQAATFSEMERGMRDAREVERLLGAFSGELEKLDEVLEVLAAYAQRMRAKPEAAAPRAKKARRVLH